MGCYPQIHFSPEERVGSYAPAFGPKDLPRTYWRSNLTTASLVGDNCGQGKCIARRPRKVSTWTFSYNPVVMLHRERTKRCVLQGHSHSFCTTKRNVVF